MQRLSLSLAVAALALIVAACASKDTQTTAAAPPPEPPVKPQEVSPKDRARLHTEIAAGYYERGQFDISLSELAEAQKLDPTYFKIYGTYGLVYTMMGENQKAEQNFRQALALAPTEPDLRANWGAFLCTTGRARESIPEFDIAIRDPLYKKPEVAMINAGKCMAQLGDTQRAEDYLRQAMIASPNNPTAAYNLALLNYRQGDLELARTYMRPVMQQNSPPPEALYLGMCIEKKKGDRQSELSYASQLRNRYPESAEAKALAAGVCE